MQTFQSDTEDPHILTEQEFPALPPRRKLITWWMHLLMGILLLVVLAVFVTAVYITILTWTAQEPKATIDFAPGHILLLISGVLTASFLLLWAGWKHSITFSSYRLSLSFFYYF
ncbi:hypothetical protein WJU16_23565 [Chitinophaga pollutisoli]|uniref:Uncharacterized protein n=1 Tax=Chitinophaga pollutisoli TaxID=3133966 RepID=A0ABZ2YNA9_9BACT